MSDESYDAALDLLRRLDPKTLAKHLDNVARLAPEIAEDLLSSVDVPLGISRDPTNGKKYLTCDYNRDLDSHRSPWSNKYYPKLEDESESPFPSSKLRKLELQLNESFDIYRDLYYEGGVSSVYLWDQPDEDDPDNDSNFAGAVLLKKDSEHAGSKSAGLWDSIHVVEVLVKGSKAVYKLTSTVILDLAKTSKVDSLSLSGNLIRQTQKVLPLTDETSHIVNIGTLIEDVEYKLRNLLQEVYFGKTRDIIGDLRSLQSLVTVTESREKQADLVKGFNEL